MLTPWLDPHPGLTLKQSFYLFLCLLFITTGCDRGLAPPPPKPSIAGKVRFLSQWPEKDSMRLMALALSSDKPPFAADQLITNLLNGKLLPVISSFGYGITDTSFYYELDTGTYYYLGVAQQFGPDPNKDWRVVGFAHDANDSALTFHVGPHDRFSDLVIDVRFDSLPKQPFVK